MEVDLFKQGATKHCVFGGCNSDNRRDSTPFLSFPKPCFGVRRQTVDGDENHIKRCCVCAKTKLWLSKCQRQNFTELSQVKRWHYICVLHFVNETGPSEENPFPLPVSEASRRRVLAAMGIMKTEIDPCPQCPYEFEWKFQVDHHVQREHTPLIYAAELFHAIVEPERFSCICCEFMTYCKLHLYEHYKQQQHGGIDENNIQQSSLCDEETAKYSCNFCRHKSDSSLCQVKHTDSCLNGTSASHSHVVVHGRKTERCAKCSYKTKRKSWLERHMLKHAPSGGIDWLQCTKCPFKSNLKRDLKKHRMTHASKDAIDWFQCAECPYKSKRKNDLKRHMMRHASSDAIDWFQCATCSFKSKWKEALTKHMMTHACSVNIYWFQCAECSYKSKRKEHLKHHMMTHASSDAIDWFQCAECSFKSKWKQDLKKHMMTHATSDDIDWFQCTKCPYKAKQKWNLKKHLRTHSSGEDDDICFH